MELLQTAVFVHEPKTHRQHTPNKTVTAPPHSFEPDLHEAVTVKKKSVI